ncbi:hypothetical protein [Crucivirus-380]|nr:hypothetical protein [Crucivirus-380]
MGADDDILSQDRLVRDIIRRRQKEDLREDRRLEAAAERKEAAYQRIKSLRERTAQAQAATSSYHASKKMAKKSKSKSKSKKASRTNKKIRACEKLLKKKTQFKLLFKKPDGSDVAPSVWVQPKFGHVIFRLQTSGYVTYKSVKNNNDSIDRFVKSHQAKAANAVVEPSKITGAWDHSMKTFAINYNGVDI